MTQVQTMLRDRRRAKTRDRAMNFLTVIAFLLMLAVLCMFSVAPFRGKALAYMAEQTQEPVMLGVSYQAEISAYTASEDETDSRPWEMASGATVYDGALACPARLAFGTRVVVEGRMYVCEDRMNGRYRDSDHFDILMGSKAEAFAFGRQSLEIIIIQHGAY